MQWLRLERWKAAAWYQVFSLAVTEVFQVENSWGSDEANSAAPLYVPESWSGLEGQGRDVPKREWAGQKD